MRDANLQSIFHFYGWKFLELPWIFTIPILAFFKPSLTAPLDAEAYFDMIGFRPGDAKLLAAPRHYGSLIIILVGNLPASWVGRFKSYQN